MSLRLKLAVIVTCGLVAGCGPNDHAAPSGTLSVLTYNVAGLPQGLKGDTQPEVNTPLISPLLNGYDLVLVQEDFAYHEALASRAEHPYQSEPKEPERLLNDGLNRFSVIPFGQLTRQMWVECNGGLDEGSDCLADKGFSVASHEVAKWLAIDVYNLHLDAGSGEVDQQVRAAQVDQLLAFMAEHSVTGPVIIAGDTNLKPASRPLDADSLDRLLTEARLQDACEFLDCGDERIDRVLFRTGGAIFIEATGWRLPEGFVDDQGQDLSDHRPVEVELSWQTSLQ